MRNVESPDAYKLWLKINKISGKVFRVRHENYTFFICRAYTIVVTVGNSKCIITHFNTNVITTPFFKPFFFHRDPWPRSLSLSHDLFLKVAFLLSKSVFASFTILETVRSCLCFKVNCNKMVFYRYPL